ncbi:metal-dependent phosphohydrolase 7TM extracellular region [Clostridium carboxidivorans P7]|uniref:Metal-dependent phosphohydrolase 7TM extracellular region n=1 Tax=Clostridium carboxidivorans P7 TaxID=536227 RepID=C6PTZ0_9CLOT|nr:metal-dependent phosphohydrolase 7TM extracellular region [Clostridium carboxidivorans P7]
MEELSIRNFFAKEKTNKIIIFILTFIFIFSVLVTSIVTKKYSLKEGDIAKVDIKAPREVRDEVSTAARIQQATDSVPIQYNKKPEVKTEIINKINSFFSKLVQVKDGTGEEKDKLQKLKSNVEISLSDDDYLTLIRLSKEDLKTVQDFSIKNMADIYDNNNISDNSQKDNQEDIKKAQESIQLKVNGSKIPKSLKDISASIGYALITPNFFYDKDKTEELKKGSNKKSCSCYDKERSDNSKRRRTGC